MDVARHRQKGTSSEVRKEAVHETLLFQAIYTGRHRWRLRIFAASDSRQCADLSRRRWRISRPCSAHDARHVRIGWGRRFLRPGGTISRCGGCPRLTSGNSGCPRSGPGSGCARGRTSAGSPRSRISGRPRCPSRRRHPRSRISGSPRCPSSRRYPCRRVSGWLRGCSWAGRRWCSCRSRAGWNERSRRSRPQRGDGGGC